MEKTVLLTTGKRRKAVARANIRRGKGVIKINTVPLSLMKNEMYRMKIMEPLILSGDVWKGYDFKVSVKGGGPSGQAEAVRQSIARGLVQIDTKLKHVFTEYDKHLIVYDSRRNEPSKPPRSSQGPRRHKQRSKR